MPKCIACKKNGKKELMHGSPSLTMRRSCKTPECMAKFGVWLTEKKKSADKKAYNRRTRELKDKTENRLQLYGKLGELVNQYAKHVRYKGQPCYTCGKQQSPGDTGGAFHAGHCFPAKRVDPRRFMLENIRIQCYRCNCKNSGVPDVYKANLADEFGEEWLVWLSLESNHKPLKELYPSNDDIRADIDYYRKELKRNGVTPRR